MNYRKYFSIMVIVLLLNLMSACNQAGSPPTATATPAPPEATATKTAKPTSTPKPSPTPNVAATQNYSEIFSDVQRFKDEGIISSTEGTYTELDDFKEEFAQRGYLTYWQFDFTVKHFVYKAHAKWSTAGETNDTSGCGIIFALEQKGRNSNYYGVVLDKKRIFFSSTYGGYYYDMGKVRGTGKLGFGNPAEADFTLVVFDYKAFVYVDDEFIGEYALSKDRALEGNFGYGIISGTNRDYGTRCEITKSRLWKINP